MAKVIGDISVSIDGFVAGPDTGPHAGLGSGGEKIHAWVFAGEEADQRALDRAAEAGAVVMGRNVFDVVNEPDGWKEGMGYGADRDARPPLFVVTSTQPDTPRIASLYEVSFVTTGLQAAVDQARAAAPGRDVYVMGGGATVRGCLEAGLLDQLRLHLSPIIMGAGIPLFDGVSPRQLKQVDIGVSTSAVHITYDVL